MAKQVRIPAVFMRGGTSKGVFFRSQDLPDSQAQRDAIFAAALGSPDPYGRQLDGLGGGSSSLSKVMIVEPAQGDDAAIADIVYTFVQVPVAGRVMDYSGNCGNLTAAVGPFAVDTGLVSVADGPVVLRLLNRNTGKIIRASFTVQQGEAVAAGALAIPGVGGTGALIQLDFLTPAGAKTGKLLPTGHVTDTLVLGHGKTVTVSCVDASNPVVFVEGAALGLTRVPSPSDLQANTALMGTLDRVRRLGGVRMGLADGPNAVPLANPKIAVLFPASDQPAFGLAGLTAGSMDLMALVLSMEKVHAALPVTTALCMVVAAALPGTVPARLARGRESLRLRIGNPSGVVETLADLAWGGDDWQVRSAGLVRTARRLMEGSVCVPAEIFNA